MSRPRSVPTLRADLAAVLAAVQAAPDDNALAAVAAGPLEDLVHDHGDALVEDIERLARQQPVFTKALRSIWLERGTLAPATEARLARWVTPI